MTVTYYTKSDEQKQLESQRYAQWEINHMISTIRVDKARWIELSNKSFLTQNEQWMFKRLPINIVKNMNQLEVMEQQYQKQYGMESKIRV